MSLVRNPGNKQNKNKKKKKKNRTFETTGVKGGRKIKFHPSEHSKLVSGLDD